MLKIAGYRILETLVDRPHVLVCRAFSENLQHNVVLKILRVDYPSAEQIAAFESEFELLKDIHGEGVPRAFELFSLDKMRILVLEDINGRSLAQVMSGGKLSFQDKLRTAINITKALATVQSKGIIHRDVKPDNIVVDVSTGRLQIADFGLARKVEKLAPGEGLSGTLHYISPEQTGRTQNAVDYRSDFYSLGVTLYELFAGRLPFSANDEMEWVHSHIAVAEPPLHEVNPQIPLPISLIVQKLMKKSPDQRYQSALGILSDLEACLEMKDPSEFQAGQHDAASTFRLSTKLYGREEEVKLVNKILAKVVLGENRLIMVNGDPGVGKSSLVNVVKDSAQTSGGYFIFGKFDQFRKDVPFSALIQAFNQLVSQILTEDETRIKAWKDRITSAMGENAAVVTEILPQVELITGKPPALQVLQELEQQQRFQHTFHAFIRACCERGRPLVLFLDDLQWADSASRSLMQMFLSEHEAESLLLIGAYRAHDVTPSHPLNKMLEDLSEKNVPRDEIHLSNLKLEDIQSLIKDSFPVSKSDPAGLSQLVLEKTNGNPFFVSQFLKTLHEKRLLLFDAFEGWRWDLEKIRAEDVTNNVLELLSQKIKGLPDEVQEVLQLAACFGNFFRVEELKSYNQKTDVENMILLQPAEQQGLVVRGRDGNYRFIHDRVQEAAYAMLSPVLRANMHYRISKELLAQWSPEKVRDNIFYLVNHFNAGREFLETTDEFAQGAELNLIAAQRAKESSVHDVSLNYASTGISILNSEDWSAYGHLLKPLMILRATSEYSLHMHEAADKTLKGLLANLSSNLEKAQVYRWMVEVAHVNDRNEDAIDLAITALKLVGLNVPKNPGQATLLLMILRARRLLLKRLRSQTPEGEKPNSEMEREALALLAAVYAPAYTVSKNFLAYVGLKAVLISLKGGYLDLPPRSLLGIYLWHVLGDFRTTNLSVEYLINAAEMRDPKSLDSKGLFTLYAATAHIVKSYKESLRGMDKTIELLSLQGHFLYKMNMSLNAGTLAALTERKLEKGAEKYSAYMNDSVRSHYGQASTHSLSLLINDLLGVNDPDLTYESVKSQADSHHSPMPRAWFIVSRMYASAIFGDYKKAFDEIAEYDAAFAQNPFTAFATQSRWLSTVVRMKNIDRVSGFNKFKNLRKIRSDLKFFRKLSAESPTNFEAPYLMLLGEWQAMRGQYFKAIRSLQAAILAAQKSEVVFHEPFANELLAEVCFKHGLDKLGASCLKDALFLYETWGAGGKVERMTAQHAFLTPSVARSSQNSISTGTISSSSSTALDLNTVLKATNALNSEIEMSRLVRKMLTILVENAGAERAVLFLNENQQLSARGEVAVNSHDEFQLTNTKFEDYANVPKAMISYVARTLEPMVLENSIEDERLNRDEYVKRNRVLSSACLPILSQGGLRGMVYLENNAAKGVFSPERVELMTILSGQIAISLENADLYEKQGEAIRMQNELITAHAVQEMLFPPANFEHQGVRVSGYYQPATECGGDWWSYSKIGDWIYCYIGDATGHGAPAALVTSAACSAVSVIESQPDITPERAMELLNTAVCRATKGQINMTFMIGALNSHTGEFRYVRASHEPALLLRKKNLVPGVSMRNCLEPLMGQNGSALGVSPEETFKCDSIQLEPGDTVVFYTDGLPELADKTGKTWGERGFYDAVHKACLKFETVTEATAQIGETVLSYKQQRELQDDVTLCMVQFTGAVAVKKAG